MQKNVIKQLHIPRVLGAELLGEGVSGRLGEAKAAGRGRLPPPLSVRVGEGRGCFPECFSEEGVACEPVPDFEDVPVGDFYQDAVPFQI